MNIVHELECLSFDSCDYSNNYYTITSYLEENYPLAPLSELDIDIATTPHFESQRLIGVQVCVYINTDIFYSYYPELAV